jgi:hypothetical protein
MQTDRHDEANTLFFAILQQRLKSTEIIAVSSENHTMPLGRKKNFQMLKLMVNEVTTGL